MRRLGGAAVLGYLVGTVPSADLACRLATGGTADLRAAGSRNPGANNAMKLLGARWGYGVMAADMVKGALACSAGRVVAGDPGAHVAGVTAVVGHCYPVWNGFRGGKGVATSFGQCVATFPAWSVPDLLVAWGAASLPPRVGVARSRRVRRYGPAGTARVQEKGRGWAWAAPGETAWWRRRHVASTIVSSTVWVAAATLWWRRGWPNLWAPRPSAALPLAAAATSAVILFRLATEPDPGPPPEPPLPPDGGDREPLVPAPSPPVLSAERPLA
ncbi:MAG: glycerol-3-phosphate acyltransferase [Actinobacteria bacterium]|nr:glycerol-3-phosphate acyltransferase [Actinomycetota bacterium]